jgi:SAM-dependent methyltransferase
MLVRLATNRALRRLAPIVLDETRRERFARLPDNVVAHDLSKGIPWPDRSVDVVYHSHLLEHLDREAAGPFLAEVRRVLKDDGIQRIVVPDLHRACRDYLEHFERCADSPDERQRHDDYVAVIIEQSVRRESCGTRGKRPLRRRVENLILGDARRRGETHQWMYDRMNLHDLLERSGFTDVVVQAFDASAIPDWEEYGLDQDPDGSEYIPGSLYVESRPDRLA